jgi:peptide/nickel transport system substrate-binding protein
MSFFPKQVRVLLWLVSAFIKRHFLFVIIGLFLGVIFFFWSKPLLSFLPKLKRTEKVGLVGKFQIDNIPIGVQKLASRGLTKVKNDGSWEGDLAWEWKVDESGKIYTFYIKDNIYWHDGKRFICGDINYNFSDVELSCKDDLTVEFKLKDPFAAFPVALSRPIFKKGLVGLGFFKVKTVKTSGQFVELILLESVEAGMGKMKIQFRFYPTLEQLETAFKLGQINKIENFVSALGFNQKNGIKISSQTKDDKYVGIFFDNKKDLLGDKNIRQAFCYSVKKDWQNRALSPINPLSWAYNENVKPYDYDSGRAKELFGKVKLEKEQTLIIGTTPEYLSLAEEIKSSWQKVFNKLKFEVKIISDLQSDFDILIMEKSIPSDPDQYIYWHSTQEETNFTHYKDPRIDKLLEDGRKTLDQEERKKIYFDFQRFLLEDVPVCFLFHPTYYTIERR